MKIPQNMKLFQTKAKNGIDLYAPVEENSINKEKLMIFWY